MSEKPFEIQLSTKSFVLAIKQQNPGITLKDAEKISDDLLNTMSNYISKGYRPAVAKQNPDESIDLIVLKFQRLMGEDE